MDTDGTNIAAGDNEADYWKAWIRVVGFVAVLSKIHHLDSKRKVDLPEAYQRGFEDVIAFFACHWGISTSLPVEEDLVFWRKHSLDLDEAVRRLPLPSEEFCDLETLKRRLISDLRDAEKVYLSEEAHPFAFGNIHHIIKRLSDVTYRDKLPPRKTPATDRKPK